MKKHDELGVHGDADVVGEFGHHAALHLGFAVGVWNKYKSKRLVLYGGEVKQKAVSLKCNIKNPYFSLKRATMSIFYQRRCVTLGWTHIIKNHVEEQNNSLLYK